MTTPKKKTTAAKAVEKETATAPDAVTNQSDTVAPVDTSAEVVISPAEIPPATEIDTSGSPQQIVPDVDLDHPAVDNDPRRATTVAQNRIDFNDPTISGREAVERNLGLK